MQLGRRFWCQCGLELKFVWASSLAASARAASTCSALTAGRREGPRCQPAAAGRAQPARAGQRAGCSRGPRGRARWGRPAGLAAQEARQACRQRGKQATPGSKPAWTKASRPAGRQQGQEAHEGNGSWSRPGSCTKASTARSGQQEGPVSFVSNITFCKSCLLCANLFLAS